MHFVTKANNHFCLSVSPHCLLLPCFCLLLVELSTSNKKEAALKIVYNNVSSIRDYLRGQDHCVKHTAPHKSEMKKKKIQLVVIVEKIVPKWLPFIVISS